MIPVYAPDVQVYLHKTVMRKSIDGKNTVSERFSGSALEQRIDMRPYLGDGAGVRTSKSINAPAGGFQITLVDKPHGDASSFETLYGLVEPMDMIEIRARHGAPLDPTQAPIVMRGFVTEVSRQEGMGSDGRPQRVVVVSGQDYGKLWQIIRISYHAAYLLGKNLISGFPLFEMYGVEAKTTMTAKEFFEQVILKIINPYTDQLMPADSLMPRAVTPDCWVRQGAVSPAIQTQQGTIYELLRYFGDVGPWNELYMEDREDGVYAVYRPNPYLNIGDDELIQNDAPTPQYIDITDQDVVALSVSRTDENISNFFWVQSQRFNLVSSTYQKQEASASGDKTVILADYPNTATRLYGIRLMELETQQGPSDMQSFDSGAKADGHQKGQQSTKSWMDDRRRIVAESNKDNVVFERGFLRLRGNEQIKAGRYLRLTRGDITSICYITQVDHEFVPFVGFFTTVQFERGTGFADRVKREGSPYLSELTNINNIR